MAVFECSGVHDRLLEIVYSLIARDLRIGNFR